MSPASLPRELVLASAGSGKTFRISSRIVALLAHGVPPDDFLASTFTRKAAGEILDRVLLRLARAALSPEAARSLSRHASLAGDPGAPDDFLDAGDALDVLEAVLTDLHRMNIGTLDSFFVRTARSFALELGLPPGWTIADEPTSRRLRSESLQELLGRADRGELVELVRMLVRGEATRRVHDRLVGNLEELQRLHRQTGPEVDDPWASLDGADPGGDPSPERWEALADAVEEVEVPRTKSGDPHRGWLRGRDRLAEALREGGWEDVFSGGIGGKFLSGSEYYGHPVPDGVGVVLERAVELARDELLPELRSQLRAMGRLARDFDEIHGEHLRREGAYRFSDVTRLLRPGRGPGTDPVAVPDELYYRLDQRVRHLLLDEFQDTSLEQWEVLDPMAGELLSGHRGERAAVIVADPKQSIYGWRGARPDLVHRVEREYALEREPMHRSWRSSQEVLDAVNRVFGSLPENPVFAGDRLHEKVVKLWGRDFEAHEAVTERPGYAPGYVRLEVGPRDGRGKDRPRLMRSAAGAVEEIRERAPGRTVGILVRTNQAVARMIYELRRRGLEVSEEGGIRLTDSPAVSAVLSLFRLADHPGDRVARYHVARTPVGRIPGIEYGDHDDAPGARRVSRHVRRELMERGYGECLGRWIRELAPSCHRRDLRRLVQLGELAFRWDGRATLRPSDFVRYVETEGVEDPTAAQIRVMTVHRAKGLEFDIVVLPDLDQSMLGGGTPATLAERDPGTGRVRRIYPYVPRTQRALLPELETAWVQHREAELRDALGILYVAMTRARYALHMVVEADGTAVSEATKPSLLIRHALHGGDEPVREGEVLYEDGDPAWHDGAPAPRREGAPAELHEPSGEIRLAPAGTDRRMVPHRTPSELDGEPEGALERILTLEAGSRSARAEGTLVHAWCREIGWIDREGAPDRRTLRRIAGDVGVGLEEPEIEELAAAFRRWVAADPVRDVLSRSRYDGEARVRTELPFAHRRAGEIVSGAIDRLVEVRDGARPVRAEVVDFKTDRLRDAGALEERVARYRPQIDAYRQAVAATRGVPAERVDATLVFLRSGEVASL